MGLSVGVKQHAVAYVYCLPAAFYSREILVSARHSAFARPLPVAFVGQHASYRTTGCLDRTRRSSGKTRRLDGEAILRGAIGVGGTRRSGSRRRGRGVSRGRAICRDAIHLRDAIYFRDATCLGDATRNLRHAAYRGGAIRRCNLWSYLFPG